MAVAFKTALGNAFSNTAGVATIQITTTAGIAVDDFVVVRWASDNASATTPTATCQVGSDIFTMQRQGAVNATAAGGVAGGILTRKMTSAYAAGSIIQVSLSNTVTGKAAYAESFTGVENTVRTASTSATGTTATANGAALGSVSAGDLLLGVHARESRAAITGATDTAQGSWSTIVTRTGGGTSGQDATSVTAAGQYKICTTTLSGNYYSGVQGTATDWWIATVAMQATPEPTVTQAAYQFFDEAGTESGATSLAALNTAVTGNVSVGDGYGVLRVRLQSTNATSLPATDDWRLQYEKNASGSWLNVGTTTEFLAAEHPEPASDSSIELGDTSTGQAVKLGQSFLGDGNVVSRVVVPLRKVGFPSGSYFVSVYSHTGTYGVNGVPINEVAWGDPQSPAGLTTTSTWISYPVPYPSPFMLVKDTPYFVGISYSAGAASTYLQTRYDFSSPTHPGNAARYNSGGPWVAQAYDCCFQVYTLASASTVVPFDNPNLIESQATTNRLGAGTGSFQAGKVTETGNVTDIGWSGNNYTELIYSLKLIAADLAGGDTLRFRVVRNGSTAGITYSQTPTISIIAGPSTITGTCVVSINFNTIAIGARVPLDVTGISVLAIGVNVVAVGTSFVPAVTVSGTSQVALNLNVIATGVNFKIVTGQVIIQIGVNVVTQGTVLAEIVSGTSALQLGITSTTLGTKIVNGASALNINLVIVTTGTIIGPILGTSVVQLDISSIATGTRIVNGTSIIPIGINVVTQGIVIAEIVTGTSIVQIGINIVVQGTVISEVITGTTVINVGIQINIVGTVIEPPRITGTSIVILNLTSTTAGLRIVKGASAAILSLTITTVGTRVVHGTSVKALTINTVTIGTVIAEIVTGTAVISINLIAIGKGTRIVTGQSEIIILISTMAIGIRIVTGVFLSTIVFDITASGHKAGDVGGMWGELEFVEMWYESIPVVDWHMV